MSDEFEKYRVDNDDEDTFEQYRDKDNKKAVPMNNGSGLEQIKQFTGANRTPVDTIRDLTQGLVTGLGKGGQFFGDLMMKIPGASSLANTVQNQGGYKGSLGNMLQPNGMSIARPDMDKVTSSIGSPNPSPYGNMAKGVGEYAPYGAMGGASMLGQMGAGGLYGASTATPDQSNFFGLLPQGKTGAAIEDAALNALTHGGVAAFNALRPSKALRGNLSPEELKANMNAASGTQTNIGDVIGSPGLKRQYENVLSKIPFSGVNDQLQRTGQKIINRGKGIIQNLSDGTPVEQITDKMNSDLIKAHAQHQFNKNNLYTDFNNAADNSGINLELPKFSSLAKSYSDAINSTNILKTEPDVANLFNKLQNYKNPVINNKTAVLDQNGQPFISKQYPTFKEGNLLKGKLNEYAQRYSNSINPSERNLGSVFSKLAKSIKGDIQSSLSSRPNILNKYNKAEDNYKNNYSHFLDKDIYPFIAGNADSDTIVQKFIKTSRTSDRANQLNTISRLLPQGSKQLATSYFSRAFDNEGNLNPAKLNTLYKSLGTNQLKVLVPDVNIRNQLKNYSKLYSMNTKAVNLMQNPATGQQTLDVLPAALAHASGSLIGSAAGIPGAIAGLAAPSAMAKIISHLMTNPKTRRNLVNSMLKPTDWNKNITPALQTGIQSNNNR